MCIIAVAYDVSRHYPLIVAANRDERHSRASAAATWWRDQPNVLAGRDLVAGGSWLGVNRRGRLAALTNIFETNVAKARLSRGHLVSRFLGEATETGRVEPLDQYRQSVEATSDDYGPFNLLLFEPGSLQRVSNRGADQTLAPGIHVLSNNGAALDWPKLGLARAGMEAVIDADDPSEDLLALLRQSAADASPPESIFVVGSDFGTRCSTVILVGNEQARLIERSFDVGARPMETHNYVFELENTEPRRVHGKPLQ